MKKSLTRCLSKLSILILISLSLFLISCAPAEKLCRADYDCLPAECCHAADAVNRDNAPDCSGVLCTAECQPGTLDCGQGEIKCLSGKCGVVMK